MGRNGNGTGTHYASVNRSDVPQGRKGKHRKAVADILADLSKLSDQQAVKIPLSSLEWQENAESSLCFEPRDAREKHPGGNVQRREILVRLARWLAHEYGSSRVAGYGRQGVQDLRRVRRIAQSCRTTLSSELWTCSPPSSPAA
jgi:hypothetical protein